MFRRGRETLQSLIPQVARLSILAFSAAALCGVVLRAQPAPMHVTAIEFFGAAGRDTMALRSALPVRVGAEVDPRRFVDLLEQVKTAARASDVAVVAGPDGGWTLYIGWPDGPEHAFRAVPHGNAALAAEAWRLARASWTVWQEAVEVGTADMVRPASDIDDRLRVSQMALRKYAMRYGDDLRHVLRTAERAEDRAVAAYLLSYGQRRASLCAALEGALADPEEAVREAAARSLLVLVRSDARATAWVRPGPLLAMVHSGRWADRQRGALLLEALSVEENPKLLAQIRKGAWAALVEMAQWRDGEQAAPARQLLGRAGGVDEPRLQVLLRGGDVEALLAAVATVR